MVEVCVGRGHADLLIGHIAAATELLNAMLVQALMVVVVFLHCARQPGMRVVARPTRATMDPFLR